VPGHRDGARLDRAACDDRRRPVRQGGRRQRQRGPIRDRLPGPHRAAVARTAGPHPSPSALRARRGEGRAARHQPRAGRPADRRRLGEKAKTAEWQTWFTNMRELIHDQAQADAWTKFGLMVGIALVTAGIGTYVEAAAGAAWGATTGFLAATGAEAISFTSMS